MGLMGMEKGKGLRGGGGRGWRMGSGEKGVKGEGEGGRGKRSGGMGKKRQVLIDALR